MNTKFIARGVLLGVSATFMLVLVGLMIVLPRTPLGSPLGPTPAPPEIGVPPGEMPSAPVGLQEYAQYQGGDWTPSGSGFVLVLGSGDLVGVTTAHSVGLGNPDRPLDRMALRVPGQPWDVAEFDTLHGTPGRPMDGPDLSVDYVLLVVDGPVDPSLVLRPDSRGGPQPGERVLLYSGTGTGPRGQSELGGTVLWADEGAAWVLMDDESFNAGMMSGSPFISQHTGQVVGMAIATSPRHLRLIPPRYRVTIGMHPIGSIVEKANAADLFSAISTYRR